MASLEKSSVQDDTYIANLQIQDEEGNVVREVRVELVGFDSKIAQKMASDLESHPEKMQERRFKFSYNNNWYTLGAPHSKTCQLRVEAE